MRPGDVLEELLERYPVLSDLKGAIFSAYEAMADCFRAGRIFLVCGNGGSCSDAEHIVGELMKGFRSARPIRGALRERLEAAGGDGAMLAGRLQQALGAVALNAPALSTAVINDLGGELAFAQQVMGLGAAGGVLMGISTSGNARNIHYAALVARAMDMRVIALTGESGGALRADCDILINVPERETYKVQELHLPVYHALCAMIEAEFFAGE